jgi:putative flavoprotein involved in K+ transport
MLDTPFATRVSNLLNTFGDALSAGDVDKAVDCFQEQCFWRDLAAFTWNIRTMEGRDQVRDMLRSQLALTKPSSWALAEGDPVTESDGAIEAWISFETEVARGYGYMRMRDGRIFTLLTSMVELKGHEEPLGFARPLGALHGSAKDRKTWKELREEETAALGATTQPYVLIVGGGQGGIILAARLRLLGVPTIIVEKNERPGDSWRKRYKSLCLHDPVWYDHLPYIPFPPHWPIFSPKDKIGDWLEMYVKVMEITYWGSSECKRASYDEKAKEWTVVVDRDGKEIALNPKQLVLATGMAGKPNMPSFPGMEKFRGDQHHSAHHPGPDAYRGKKAVIIGSNNSAHDIAAALYEAGADVTMVQRSTTHVSRSDTLMELGLGPLYSEEAVRRGISVEKADLLYASIPYRILHEGQIRTTNAIRERDAEFYKRLEATGFMLDFGDDESGITMKYMRRGSGYYIDIGASELIIDGSIKLKSGHNVKELTEDAVILEDGTRLLADLVVYATGYGSMNGFAADLISQDVADKVGKVWGLGSATTKDPGPWEGELRNLWKPTQQEALWFQGGNLHQARHYSQFLALQLKARMEGIPTPVYGLQERHHLE